MNEILEKYKLFLGVQYRKQNSQVRYLNAAQKFLGHIENITGEEIQQYLIFLNQTQKPKSIRANIYGMNKLLKYLQLDHLKVRVPRDRRITRNTINRDQIMRLYRHAKETRGYQDYVILLMIRDLKCRNHEIIKTQWDWIYDDQIHFHDCKTGDTTGPISQELKEALMHWKQITPYPDKPYVFCILRGQYKGRQMSDKGGYIRGLINQMSIEVVGRRLNPQDLRASIMTAEFSNCVDPRVIMMTARHKNLETTLIYNHANGETAAEYIRQGTIFSDDKHGLFKQTVKTGKDKPYDIYPFCIPNLSDDEDDNNRFSFSVSFFIDCLNDGKGGTTIDDHVREWSEFASHADERQYSTAGERRLGHLVHTPDLIQNIHASFDHRNCANMEATRDVFVLFSFFSLPMIVESPASINRITTIFHQDSSSCSGEASFHVTRRAVSLFNVKEAGIPSNKNNGVES